MSRIAMISLYSASAPTTAILNGALTRSFSSGQIRTADSTVAVAVDPMDELLPNLRKLAGQGGKVIVLGRPAPAVAAWLGLDVADLPPEAAEWGVADIDRPSSAAWVAYGADPVWSGEPPYERRWLCRFDFTTEWNNMGYGRITTDGGPWSLSCLATAGGAGTRIIGSLCVDGNAVGAFATITDYGSGAALWINRAVGPVDGLDWTLVERFISDYRAEDLVCLPRLEDVPPGYDATVTMRLDCDQDISSARALHELYRQRAMPFSFAVLTGLPMDADDLGLLDEVVRGGGSAVSHSVTHIANWGGSPEAARNEAAQSRRWLEERFGAPMVHAVSPFHQNPPYAVEALAETGYEAFVAGIICNDPEALTARTGIYPAGDGAPVLVSQQTMLHGDCYHAGGAGLSVYQQAFLSHLRARAVFGWLDHPLSSSYQYGWLSLDEQLTAHRDWLDFLEPFSLWRVNLSTCLHYAATRSRVKVALDADGRLRADLPGADGLPPFAATLRGEMHVL